MISIELVTIILITVGLLIIAVSFISLKRQNKASNSQLTISKVELEKISEEINDTALEIYNELDDKYKEILVIYNLIDKKYKEIEHKKVRDIEVHQVHKNEIESKNYEITNKNYETMKLKKPNKFNSNGKGKVVSPVLDEDSLALKVVNKNIENEKQKKPNNKQDEVLEQLKKGYTVKQIAKNLNIGVGEVQFIKELSKVKNE